MYLFDDYGVVGTVALSRPPRCAALSIPPLGVVARMRWDSTAIMRSRPVSYNLKCEGSEMGRTVLSDGMTQSASRRHFEFLRVIEERERESTHSLHL